MWKRTIITGGIVLALVVSAGAAMARFDGEPPAPATGVIDAAPAGTITVDSSGGQLRLVSVETEDGWSQSRIDAADRRIAVDFSSDGMELEVAIELDAGGLDVQRRLYDDRFVS